MNLFKQILIILFFLVSCKTKNNAFTNKNIDKDSTIVKLKRLKETELTRIEIDPVIYFADTISQGQTIEGKFKIINVGNVPFSIKKIVNICDCTVTEPTKKETQPNDSCYINFKIDTENYKEGFNVRMITIMGNFHPFFRVLSVECYVGNKK